MLSCGDVCFVIQCGSNFLVCGSNHAVTILWKATEQCFHMVLIVFVQIKFFYFASIPLLRIFTSPADRLIRKQCYSPRQMGKVLIDTGVIACPWLLLSLSEQVS